jgi:hypothetical protein
VAGPQPSEGDWSSWTIARGLDPALCPAVLISSLHTARGPVSVFQKYGSSRTRAPVGRQPAKDRSNVFTVTLAEGAWPLLVFAALTTTRKSLVVIAAIVYEERLRACVSAVARAVATSAPAPRSVTESTRCAGMVLPSARSRTYTPVRRGCVTPGASGFSLTPG